MQAKDNDCPQNGGGHPWSIQPGTASTLLLFNHSADTTRRFNVLIGTEKAEQWQKCYYLAPLETKAISINEIVEKQMADERGTRSQGRCSWSGHLVHAQPEVGQRTADGFAAATGDGPQLQLRHLRRCLSGRLLQSV